MAEPNQTPTIYLAKRMLVDSIWKEAHIEVPGITFPTTQEIFDGRIPEGIDLQAVLVVNNLKHAWEYLLSNIDRSSDLELICNLNREIGNAHLIPYAGYIRKFSVGISGTNYVPEIPNPDVVGQVVAKILKITDPLDRALEAFCRIVREQWFPDGNKRTAQLWTNYILIQNDVGILAVPIEARKELGILLIEYYETGNDKHLRSFLLNKCLVTVNIENTVTHNDSFIDNDTVNDTVKLQTINLITDNPSITAQKMSEQTGKSLRTIRRHLKDMQTSGLIMRVGSDRTGHWEIINHR